MLLGLIFYTARNATNENMISETNNDTEISLEQALNNFHDRDFDSFLKYFESNDNDDTFNSKMEEMETDGQKEDTNEDSELNQDVKRDSIELNGETTTESNGNITCANEDFENFYKNSMVQETNSEEENSAEKNNESE
ncbi:putative SP-containing protein [Vairimorpha necatrix]|uniref:SP-containing protein n=1 Tax=Vairimorpha necatrix TaxID=6039 RepID=A0AAX4JFU2_9MICR